jgi:DNA-binding MarR family transcriptional regulator
MMNTDHTPTDIYSELCGEYAKKRSLLRLWYRLIACHVHSTRPAARFLTSQSKISLPGYDVLTVLARRPDGINMSQLARLLLVGKSNVTGIVSGLEKSGFIVRVVTRADKRGRLVKFTRRGKAFWKRTNDRYEGFIERLLEGISPAERIEIEKRLTLMQNCIAMGRREMDE